MDPAPASPSSPAERPSSSLGALARMLLLALIAIVTVVGIGLFLRARSDGPVAYLILPSGESISVRAASYGTNHPAPDRFPLEHRLPPAAREWVARALGRSGPAGRPITTRDPALVVWARVQPPAAAKAVPGPWITTFVAEAPSTNAPLEQRGYTRDTALFPSTEWYPIEFKAFPRRAHRLALAIQQRTGNGTLVTLGSIPFANPAAANPPTWAADPLPTTKAAGDLEATIEGFLVGAGNGMSSSTRADGRTRISFSHASPGEASGAALVLALRDRAHPTNVWSIESARLLDPGGNVARAESQSRTSQGAAPLGRDYHRYGYRWSPLLWNDDVWELQIDAKREAGSAFADDERVVFEKLALPEVDGTNRLSQVAQRSGLTLKLESILRRPPLTDSSWSGTDLTTVQLHAAGMAPRLQVELVNATDDQGRRFVPVSRSTGSTEDSNDFDLGFGFRDIPTNSRTLTLEFVVQQLVTLRFRVDPRVAHTNAVFGWD